MKIKVKNKSVIARNLNSIIWAIISCLVIYVYSKYYLHVVEKYNRTLFDVFLSDYTASAGDQVIFITGFAISFIFLFVLIVNMLDITKLVFVILKNLKQQ